MDYLKYAVIYLLFANIVSILKISSNCGSSLPIFKFTFHWCDHNSIYGIVHTKSWSFWCIYIGRFSIAYGVAPVIE